MAFSLSPGINVSEIDLTTIVPAVGSTTGAIAGPFRWGPANQLILLDSELALRNRFGKPDNNTAASWFTAANFLAYANALQTVRVIHTGVGGHKNATADGSGLLIPNDDFYSANYANGQGAVGMWTAKYAGDLGNSLLVSLADSKSFASWTYNALFQSAPGTSAFVTAGGGSNDEVHVLVIDALGKFTGVPGTVLEQFPFLSKCATAKAENGTSIYYAEVINRTSKYIWWTDHPTIADLGLSSGSVNWGGIESTSFQNTATTLTLTNVSGTFAANDVVTSQTTVTIAVSGSGAAGTVQTTGNVITGVTITNGGTGYTGNFPVAFSGAGSNAAGTAVVANGSVQSVNITNGGTGYTGTPTVSFTVPGSGATATATVTNGAIASLTVTAGGTLYASAPVVTIIGTGTGASVTANVSGGAVTGFTIVNGGTGYTPATATVVSYASNTLVLVPTSGNLAVGLTVGNSGNAATGRITAISGGALTRTLAGGVDANGSVVDADYLLAYDLFSSSENVDISLILTGNVSTTVSSSLISNIAEVRKDCVVFVSPQYADVVNNAGGEAVDIIATRNSMPSSSYAVMDSGWKYQYDKYNDVYRWLPLNGDIAGLCVNTDNVRDPWWSPAGYNRGSIKNVVKLAYNPRKADRDVLYNNGINPVISQPGQGTVLFGDKTMQSKPSAFDRINVRRLFIVLEKAIATAAKYTLFEFNDPFTRAQFVNMVTPFLTSVKGRRGISDFLVVCDATNNTAQVVDSNQFVGDIYVKPARSINFIQLNFVAVASGVAFSEIVGQF